MENSEQSHIRKIIHVDMDAFYASVEQRDNPEYRGRPIIVGGSPEGRGGVVATASYEARKYGVRSAMSSKQAQKLCPGALFVRARFDAYKEASAKIREIFSRYTDLIEPLSLDEAYLDVTNDKLGIGSALEIAKRIKEDIRRELNLTASAGVSVNKFVAKVASDINKPDGLKFIGPSSIKAFMESLPIEKFYGVGKVTASKMRQLGIHTGADLKRMKESDLIRHFGKSGRFYYRIVRGIDNREVQTHREAKSLAAEDTFPYDLRNMEEMEAELEKIGRIVTERLERKSLSGRTITLKIKFADFRQITRNRSFAEPICDYETIISTAKELLGNTILDEQRIRLLGISVSNFGQGGKDETFNQQLSLFD